MRNKVVIVACVGVGSDITSTLAKKLADYDVGAEIIVNNIEVKNTLNSVFRPEPLVIEDYHRNLYVTETKVQDLPRNKFIDKPRFNHLPSVSSDIDFKNSVFTKISFST